MVLVATRVLIENAGFRCERIETGYMPGPKPVAFLYEGRAALMCPPRSM
jgi:hypothetical protein